MVLQTRCASPWNNRGGGAIYEGEGRLNEDGPDREDFATVHGVDDLGNQRRVGAAPIRKTPGSGSDPAGQHVGFLLLIIWS
jgi:hypothetical protein